MDHLEHDGAEAQVEISLSIEETNALRAKLGLKPLSLDKTDAEVLAETNFTQKQDEIKRKNNVSQVQKRLQRSRNRLKLREKLVGTTLGAADDSVLDDVSAWARRQKGKSNLATRYEDEDAETIINPSHGSNTDTSVNNHLGVGVAHNIDESLAQGSELILTLMDKNVLDEDEQDVLENVNLRDAERTQQSLDNRTRKIQFGFTDDVEQVTMGRHTSRSILSHYDNIVDGQQVPSIHAPRYILGEDGLHTIVKNEDVTPEELLKAKAMSLEYEKQRQVDDFKSADEVGFKKPKKNKRKTNKLRTQTSDKDDDMMLIDANNVVTNRAYNFTSTTSFVDDDELQSVLAAARRKSIKRAPPPPSMDEIVQDLVNNGPQSQIMDVDSNENDNENGLVFDEVAEFVRRLDTDGILASVKAEPGTNQGNNFGHNGSDQGINDDKGDDNNMNIDPHPHETNIPEIKMEDEDKDENENEVEESHNPLVDEPEMDGGLASAIEFFRKRGDLEEVDEVMLAREREYKAREQWDVHNMAALGISSGRETSKAALKRRAETHAERLKNYKPNVNIEYFDELGQQLSTKEAFKELSHKFHGRGPGKNKIEKMMRKEEERRRQLNMGSGDKASELTQAMIERQKHLGTAAIQLTEGNRPVSAGPTLVGSNKNNHSKSNKLQRRG